MHFVQEVLEEGRGIHFKCVFVVVFVVLVASTTTSIRLRQSSTRWYDNYDAVEKQKRNKFKKKKKKKKKKKGRRREEIARRKEKNIKEKKNNRSKFLWRSTIASAVEFICFGSKVDISKYSLQLKKKQIEKVK